VVLDRAFFGEGRWLAEFRNLSIVSVQLPEEDSFETLQRATLAIQTVSARFEGTVLDLFTNGRGVSALIVFGLPPIAHRDDALRAVEAAMALHQNLVHGGIPASIGVATGRLFCGEYGGKARRHYSALGQAINLSARLMAVAGSEILCDAATFSSVHRQVCFSSLGNVPLKGWPDPVPIYRPEAVLTRVKQEPERSLFGREMERRILREALAAAALGEGQTVVVQGEAGIGKSRLLTDLIGHASANNCAVFCGGATAIEKSTLYFPWREVLLQLIGSSANAPTVQIEDKLQAALSEVKQLSAWAPLLDDVLHAGLVQSALTRDITGAPRASSIEDLVVHLLKRAASKRSTLLAFEDLHWFDNASLALLRGVALRVKGVLVVVTSRSDEGVAGGADEEFAAARFVKVGAMSSAAVADVVRHRLGVASVPEEFGAFVNRHAGGNPFFCEELLLALRDAGVIELNDGVCRINGDLEEASRSTLSVDIEGAVVSRIDALPPPQQMALKVASVIGAEFSPATLRTIYPDALTANEMRTLLDRLAALELLRVHKREGDDVYDFRHAIIRRVTYDQLSFAQRRGLHREIADSVERLHGDRLGLFHGQLAFHRELADQPKLAIEHLGHAADQALRSFANRDAIQYAEKAIQLAHSLPAGVDHRRRAAWEITLGDAHHELRVYEKASEHYEHALIHLGFGVPATQTQTVRSLLGNAVQQAAFRMRGPLPLAADPQTRIDMQWAAHIYERLSEEYFYLNDALRILHGTLASLNLAERSGSTAETISGYNGLALGLAMSGLPGLARFYSGKAFAIARKRGGKPEIARANLVGSVLASGLGERERAHALSLEAAASFRELGDQARLQNVLVGMAFEHMMHSDIASAEDKLNELAGPDYRDANNTIRAWRLCARAVIDTVRGEIDEATLSELSSVTDAKHAPADRLLCLGVLASAHERRGECELARAFAERGFDVLRRCRVVWSAYGVYGAAGVVGNLVADWERAVAARSSDSAAQTKARAASRMFYRAARSSPLCRPAALLYRGSTFFLDGKKRRAMKNWRGAVHCADDLHMQYFLGLAWLQIAKSSERTDPARELAFARAKQAFQAVGATVDLSNSRLASV
jgi:adenylate cyclase